MGFRRDAARRVSDDEHVIPFSQRLQRRHGEADLGIQRGAHELTGPARLHGIGIFRNRPSRSAVLAPMPALTEHDLVQAVERHTELRGGLASIRCYEDSLITADWVAFPSFTGLLVRRPRDRQQKGAVFERLDIVRQPAVQRQQPSGRQIECPALRSHLEMPRDSVD